MYEWAQHALISLFDFSTIFTSELEYKQKE